MLRQTVNFLISIVVASCLFGCGGSTTGTGGIQIEGRALESGSRAPLSGAVVRVPATGDQVVAGVDGSFTVQLNAAGEFEFEFETENGTASGVLTVEGNASKIKVTFEIEFENGTATPEDVEIEREDDDDDHDSGSSGSSDDDDNSSSSSGEDDNSSSSSNDDDDSSSSSDDDISGSSSDDDSEIDDDGEPEPDQELEVRGLIQQLSSGSVTVAGETFILNSQTEYEDENSQHVTLSYFSVGDEVKVRGYYSNGVLIAEKLEMED